MDWISYPVIQQIYISKFYSMFRINLDKAYIFPGETHIFGECVYVISGSVCVYADERVYNMNAGDMIFHKPYELHKYYVTGGKNAELFIFSYSAIGKLCDYFCNMIF